MNRQRVFFYVQHLLGIGHLKRAATLARAVAADGTQVTLASGGLPVAGFAKQLSAGGVDLVQLPPASAADLGFKDLVDGAGQAVDEAWKRARAEALLGAWRAADAQAMVLELFPFGRRQMRFELLPLLEAATAGQRRPAIVCSVRDILGSRKSPQRQAETVELVERHFDQVLVHADPAIVRFEHTFPLASRIAGKLHYTGYVVDGSGTGTGSAGRDEVIVSAGGGAVGAELLLAAMRAKPLSLLRERTWRVLAGSHLPDAAFEQLAGQAAADRGIVLERARPDFTQLLANCALSISQAGYNTLMETVRAGARAVVVPFEGGQETEQAQRARHFAARGLLEVVEESALTPASLAAAADRAARLPPPAWGAIDLDGARKGAALIRQWAGARPA